MSLAHALLRSKTNKGTRIIMLPETMPHGTPRYWDFTKENRTGKSSKGLVRESIDSLLSISNESTTEISHHLDPIVGFHEH
jgi:hypothetical protein